MGNFEDGVSGLRKSTRNLGSQVVQLKTDSIFSQKEKYPGQHGEMMANIMLAYRHLEDARMRLGKVLQAWDDGVSVYDK